LTELCTKHHCVKRGKKSHNVNCTKGVADLSTLTTVFHLQYYNFCCRNTMKIKLFKTWMV